MIGAVDKGAIAYAGAGVAAAIGSALDPTVLSLVQEWGPGALGFLALVELRRIRLVLADHGARLTSLERKRKRR